MLSAEERQHVLYIINSVVVGTVVVSQFCGNDGVYVRRMGIVRSAPDAGFMHDFRLYIEWGVERGSAGRVCVMPPISCACSEHLVRCDCAVLVGRVCALRVLCLSGACVLCVYCACRARLCFAYIVLVGRVCPLHVSCGPTQF